MSNECGQQGGLQVERSIRTFSPQNNQAYSAFSQQPGGVAGRRHFLQELTPGNDTCRLKQQTTDKNASRSFILRHATPARQSTSPRSKLLFLLVGGEARVQRRKIKRAYARGFSTARSQPCCTECTWRPKRPSPCTSAQKHPPVPLHNAEKKSPSKCIVGAFRNGLWCASKSLTCIVYLLKRHWNHKRKYDKNAETPTGTQKIINYTCSHSVPLYLLPQITRILIQVW